MSLITKVAHFNMCDCGFHGHLMLRDGTVHTEVLTKPQGRRCIEKLLEERRIDKDDAGLMRAALDETHLPEREADIAVQLRKAVSAHSEVVAVELTQGSDEGPVKTLDPVYFHPNASHMTH